MLIPTPEWRQAMRTFVRSLEMRAQAAAKSADQSARQQIPADITGPVGPPESPDDSGAFAASHPLIEFQAIAEYIIQTAPAAYRLETLNRAYWDQFGIEQTNRTNSMGAFLRAKANKAMAQISVANLWTQLGTTTAEVASILHEITWHLAQAAGMSFPAEDDVYPDTNERYAGQVQKLASGAAAHVMRLRPYTVCLSAILRESEQTMKSTSDAGRPTDTQTQPETWGPSKPVKWWTERLGISNDTFRRRRDSGEYRTHPNSTMRSVAVALDDLTPEQVAAVRASLAADKNRGKPH
jgi:hypothetical protein